MKTRFLLMFILAAFGINLNAQPLNWRESSPVEWVPITIEPEFNMVTEGTKAVKITFTELGTPYFVSDTFNVAAETTFSYSLDVLDNDPGAEINLRVRFIKSDGSGENLTSGDYTVDNGNYQTITFTGTTPVNTVKAYVIVRMYDLAAAWSGSGTFYLDNAKFTVGGGTTNLLANGGFENWQQPYIPVGALPLNWREDSPAEWVPATIEPEFTKVSHGMVATKITFTETGTPYFVSDTFNVNANVAFNTSIDILDNDPGSEYNIRVRFIKSDGSAENLTSGDYSVDNADYQTYTFTGTTPATSVKAYVIVRLYDVAANWTGSGMAYFDNARFTLGDENTNILKNPSFESWTQDEPKPAFLTYKFAALNPAVSGIINKIEHTVGLTVPFATNLTNLVATFTLSEGATAQVSPTVQESGVTPNDFTNPVTYTLISQDGATTQDWKVSVGKAPAADGKDIISFRFEGLNPAVNGIIDNANFKIAAEVPNATDITALVTTIQVSPFATISPASGTAQNFTNPVTYTVTAEDGTTQAWVVTVTKAVAGKVTLFAEDFEGITILPADFVVINNDGYTQAVGEENWQDSAWTVATSTRVELSGTQVAMSSSYCSNMPLDGRADDWMILPAITIGVNTTLSWQAMSTTSSGNYPDDYMVVIAQSVDGTAPTVAYFESEGNILATVAPESWSTGVSNPGEGLKNRSVNLKDLGWASKKVWIAFVLTTDRYTNPITGVPNSTAGGSNLAVDNILLVDDTGNDINEFSKDKLLVDIYPNPVTETINLAVTAEKNATAIITISDMIGKVVFAGYFTVDSGSNSLSINAEGLMKGVYMVQTSVNGKSQVSKIIVK